jgi:Pyruvate/2-oxoacid:ferredoxin oxidoreductase delta subunit
LPEEVKHSPNAVVIDKFGRTNLRGKFAGGDAAGLEQSVVAAIGSGKYAAVAIHEFLQKGTFDNTHLVDKQRIGYKGSFSMGKYLKGESWRKSEEGFHVIQKEHLNLDYFKPEPRIERPQLPIKSRKENFREVDLGYSREEAMKEAARCFNCAVCTECDNCFIFCPDMAVQKLAEGGYQIQLDYCKGCGICAVECPRGVITMKYEQSFASIK